MKFTDLSQEQEFAILQMVYQLIVSSKKEQTSEFDEEIIGYAESALGFWNPIAWNLAIDFDPHKSFAIITNFSNENKINFRNLIFDCIRIAVNKGYNKKQWVDIGSQIIKLTNC